MSLPTGAPQNSSITRRSRFLLITCGILVVIALWAMILDSMQKRSMLDGLSSVYGKLVEQTTPTSTPPSSDEFVSLIPISTAGAPGVNGAAGATGVQGVAGQDGTSGSDGLNGANGIAGTDGANGTNGMDGIDGQDGQDGADGTNGINGTNGTNGVDGQDGADGVATCPNGVCASLQAAPNVQETGVIYVDDVVATTIQGNGAALTNLDAGNIATGTVADGRLSGNVTLLGNVFNGTSQLVQTTAGGLLPALSGANITNIQAGNISAGTLSNARLSAAVTLAGNSFNSASQLVQLDGSSALPSVSGAALTALDASNIASGTLADGRLSTNVTIQGNTFNGNSQLVQLTGSGALPALSGANLTAINGSNITSGSVADARLSGTVTVQGNSFNASGQLVQLDGSGQLPAVSGALLTNINGSNIAGGTVADARLSTNVTAQGNVFNGTSQLVLLTGAGLLPALNGSALTNLNASNIASGTLADARLSSNIALLNRDSQTFTGDNTVFKNDNNSSTAFSVQDSAASTVLGVDTQSSIATATNLKATTGLTVGSSGTALQQIVVYTPSLNPANVPAATTAEQTYTVNGLSTSDTVIINKPSLTNGCGIIGARVSATNTLAITWVNVLGILGCDPPSETYKVIAIRS